MEDFLYSFIHSDIPKKSKTWKYFVKNLYAPLKS